MLKDKLEELPELYSTDGTKGDLPAVRYYIPNSEVSWVLWEFTREEDTAFGLCDLGLGFPEMGFVSLTELEGLERGGYSIHHDHTVTTRFKGYAQSKVPVPGYLKG